MVGASSTEINGLNNHVTFDVVDFNIGGAWNTSTYQIVVPVSGKYYVIVDISSCSNFYIRFELFVNNFRIAIARFPPSDVYAANAAATARGQSIVIQLTFGDVLYIRVSESNTCYYGLYTTFSGIYLGP